MATMIKIFRGIRQRMISEGKSKKYLLYAIGEIILVVIGILIALQINNWNETRKQRTTEKVYIENIKTDLSLNLKSLNNYIALRNETIESVELILEFFNNKRPLDLNEFNRHCLTVMAWHPFENNDNTYQELMNSGKFSILTNKSMKDSLQNLQTNLNSIRFIESEMEEDYERYLYEPFFAIIDLDTSLKNLKSQFKNAESIPKMNREEVEMLLKNRTFKNGFVLAGYNSNGLIEEYENMINTTNQLYQLIDKDLDQ